MQSNAIFDVKTMWVEPDGSTRYEDSKREFSGQPPTEEELTQSQWGFVRRKRDGLLSESDWTALPDVPLSAELRQQWQVYRQALRDVTLQPDPLSIVWPEPPQ